MTNKYNADDLLNGNWGDEYYSTLWDKVGEIIAGNPHHVDTLIANALPDSTAADKRAATRMLRSVCVDVIKEYYGEEFSI